MSDIKITKTVTNVSISSSLIGKTNLLPGSTIHYEISWTNRGNVALTNVIIYDKIPTGTVYAALSLSLEVAIGSSSWDDEWSAWVSPDQTFGSLSYGSSEPVPAKDCKWVRSKCANLPAGESGYMRFKVILSNIEAGTLIPNIANVTFSQALAVGSNAFNLTVATQYGGSFSFVSDKTGVASILGGTNYFDIAFTNKGNITLDFPLTMPYLSSPFCLLNYWNIAFVTNDVVINSIDNLKPKGVFLFQVRIITTNSLLAAGHQLDFHIRAQAGGNTSAVAYSGDDGREYGGSIGKDVNGTSGVNPGYIFQQGNTNITLKLAGAVTLPILEITKSVSNIILGGLPQTRPIPGATVSYIISYSNAGDAPAIFAMVYDAIPANAKYMTNYMLPSTTGWTTEFSESASPDQSYNSPGYSDTYTAKTNVTYVRWKIPSLADGEKGTFIYKVIIK